MGKKQKKQGSRIIQFFFLFSFLGIIMVYIVDIWYPLVIVQVLKTILYVIVGMTIVASLLSWLFGGKDDVDGGIII